MEILYGVQKARVSTALKWQKMQKMSDSTHRHKPTHTYHIKVLYRTRFSTTAMAENISISQRHYLNQAINDSTIKPSANSLSLTAPKFYFLPKKHHQADFSISSDLLKQIRSGQEVSTQFPISKTLHKTQLWRLIKST